jgi:hypothetical protein
MDYNMFEIDEKHKLEQPMSKMSDLHIEIQELLANGHGVQWIAHTMNVPWSVVQEIQNDMAEEDEIVDPNYPTEEEWYD